ncbi:DUF3737 family protein [Slackia isoflavoniconvertens]|uniref:DUF3737 domain-containing protein n=1 Tax=Slackia isoflavoniconvertens TaxID=572010 RepID=A0A369LF71_9ACTN|nr:DUF3737 family protein [Slackia isoflavoniconvertens]RDB57970.1 DUF3737 domain-containing protein [Slackia isoflavoniconvertens]
MKVIENERFDEERALYGSHDIEVVDCSFDGPADGESAFKESRGIEIKRCFFNLRYPFWHNDHLRIESSEMTELCRAALWYCDDVFIQGTKMHGIKALRECSNARLIGCDIVSPEFGWSVRGVSLKDCSAESEYFLMRSSDISLKNVRLNGKYSFQYVNGGAISDSHLKTKDALWHSKDVTVKDTVLEGEYLAWYSEDLTLVNCTIRGTQPFCYCKGLKLIDCVMENTDLSFEKSEVDATVLSCIDSVKNPLSGRIVAETIGELVADDPTCMCAIETTGQSS